MTIPFDKLKNKWLKDTKIRTAYEALGEEYALTSALINARTRAGLSQEELAAKMGTTQPTIARLESGHKPSLRTLERFAAATQSRLQIKLEPANSKPNIRT